MDESLQFFALGDPHYFDVPWSTAHRDPALRPSVAAGGAWRERVEGLWRFYAPVPARVPEAGWKIHISARPQHAQATIDVVAEVCYAEKMAWKSIRSTRLALVAQSKFAPPALVGKLCVAYPADEEQLTRVLIRLTEALHGCPGPRVPGDHHHATAPVGVRWGAFLEAWTQDVGGRPAPAVRDGDVMVPDRRGQRGDKPLPDTLAGILTNSSGATLPIRDGRLVRRTSAGALYRAVLEDGRTVALKEARHHAGIDHEGTDAVTRLRHEHAVLRHLSGEGVGPEVVDYWELDHSDILVMEWLEGDTLARRITRTHPRGRAGTTEEQAGSYWTWAAAVNPALSELVARLHALGVAHGDLQPTNVILGERGLRVIDFECAALQGTAVTTTTGTPGFQLDHPDPYERDRFALARTQACTVDLDIALVDQRPDLIAHFDATAATPQPDLVTERPAFLGSIEELQNQLAGDLEQRATPERADRLFPGGADQFRTPLGAHDLLSGAAGTLLALQAVGRSPDPQHLDWLADPPPTSSGMHGLGAGIEGVALALALLGRQEQAEGLLDASGEQLPGDVSWLRGQAGCAVALVELGQLLGRPDLTERGVAACEMTRAAVADDTASVPGFGLLEGWSGVALALLRVGQLLPQETARAQASAYAALTREQSALIPAGDTLVTHSAGRVNTTLGRGTGGFVLAAARLCHVAGDQGDDGDQGGQDSQGADLHAAATVAARGCASVVPPVAGLLDGLIGSVAVLRALGGHARTAAMVEDRASWHCVPTPTGWSLLGDRRVRCSDDLGTGTAGFLAGLGPQGPTRLTWVLRLPTVPVED